MAIHVLVQFLTSKSLPSRAYVPCCLGSICTGLLSPISNLMTSPALKVGRTAPVFVLPKPGSNSHLPCHCLVQWCEYMKKVSAKEVVHAGDRATVMAALPWCYGRVHVHVHMYMSCRNTNNRLTLMFVILIYRPK